MTPGKHRITLHCKNARMNFRPERQEIELDLEACTRYRIAANYEVKSGPNLKPKFYSGPIGESRKKFSKQAAAAQ